MCRLLKGVLVRLAAAGFALGVLGNALAADKTPDLTGQWQNEKGVPYQLRQVKDRLFWMADNRPDWINVGVGTINDNRIDCEWADLPGGKNHNAGSLTLSVEGPDRLTLVKGSKYGGGQTLTRRTTDRDEPAPANANPSAPGKEEDLTGMWQNEKGVPYHVRQVKDRFYWLVDNRPGWINACTGTINGNTIECEWADLPGGKNHNAGTLTLTLESPDRLKLVKGSQYGGGQVFHRVQPDRDRPARPEPSSERPVGPTRTSSAK